MEPEIIDMHGETVHDGDTIMYDGWEFVAEYVGKESKWLAHPCGNNPSNEDLDLTDIPEDEIELVQTAD